MRSEASVGNRVDSAQEKNGSSNVARNMDEMDWLIWKSRHNTTHKSWVTWHVWNVRETTSCLPRTSSTRKLLLTTSEPRWKRRLRMYKCFAKMTEGPFTFEEIHRVEWRLWDTALTLAILDSGPSCGLSFLRLSSHTSWICSVGVLTWVRVTLTSSVIQRIGYKMCADPSYMEF